MKKFAWQIFAAALALGVAVAALEYAAYKFPCV